VTKEDKIRNEFVKGSIGVASIMYICYTLYTYNRWFGHVMRRKETKAVRVVMKMNVDGKRVRRRPK